LVLVGKKKALGYYPGAFNLRIPVSAIILPLPLARHPRVAEALAEAQALAKARSINDYYYEQRTYIAIHSAPLPPL
jgi:hypothetical protein